MIKIAINGFGRIGRNAFKIAFEHPELKIVAINGTSDPATYAHLLKYDSTYGSYYKDICASEDAITVDDQKILAFSERDAAKLPWQQLGIDIVLECTGVYADPAKAKIHLQQGAKKVVIASPAKGDGAKTIVLGVNEQSLTASDNIISCASCTTNCIAPVMKVLEDSIGIKKALMTTVHSYTPSQNLLDGNHKDLREARSAAENIIPTTTGASKNAALVIPSLTDKFNGLSIRVPTPVVSLSDVTAVTKRPITKDELNKLFIQASKSPRYQGILAVNDKPLVSCDFRGNTHSAIVDIALSDVVDGDLIKVVAWYDNEWGYSNRLVELALLAAQLNQDSPSQSKPHSRHIPINLQPKAKSWKSSLLPTTVATP